MRHITASFKAFIAAAQLSITVTDIHVNQDMYSIMAKITSTTLYM